MRHSPQPTDRRPKRAKWKNRICVDQNAAHSPEERTEIRSTTEVGPRAPILENAKFVNNRDPLALDVEGSILRAKRQPGVLCVLDHGPETADHWQPTTDN